MSENPYMEIRIRLYEEDCPNLFRLISNRPTPYSRNAVIRLSAEIGAGILIAQEEKGVEAPSADGTSQPQQGVDEESFNMEMTVGLLESMGIEPLSGNA